MRKGRRPEMIAWWRRWERRSQDMRHQVSTSNLEPACLIRALLGATIEAPPPTSGSLCSLQSCSHDPSEATFICEQFHQHMTAPLILAFATSTSCATRRPRSRRYLGLLARPCSAETPEDVVMTCKAEAATLSLGLSIPSSPTAPRLAMHRRHRHVAAVPWETTKLFKHPQSALRDRTKRRRTSVCMCILECLTDYSRFTYFQAGRRGHCTDNT